MSVKCQCQLLMAKGIFHLCYNSYLLTLKTVFHIQRTCSTRKIQTAVIEYMKILHFIICVTPILIKVKWRERKAE